MRGFWRSNLRGAPQTSARTSSDESVSTRVEPAPNGQARDVEKTQELEDSKIPFLTVRTFVMAILAAMGGFIFGYDTGQISGFLAMQVFKEYFGELQSDGTYHFSDVRSGLIVALLSIGTLIGCLIAAPLSNKWGRKTCIPLWCIVFCVGVTIQIAVQNGQWVGIVMGRWVAGLGVGGMSVLVPLYVSESTPKHVRGAAVCCYQLFITIGIFTADCINYGTEARTDTGSYRIPMGVGYIWAIILGVGMLFMPESPRWDIRNENHARAFTTMTKFYGVSRHHRAVYNETKEINEALDASSGNHPWWEAFTAPRMLYRILLGMSLQSLQQLTGANYFFYYGTTIFTGVGIQNPFVTAMILGGVNVGSTFFGLYMVEHFGRRKCLYWGAIWMFVCFMVFASLGHFKFNPANTATPPDTSTAKSSGTVMIVFACLFILAFASTWGPMVWAVTGEMFPYRYRAVSMAMTTAANWFWNFMLAFFTTFITSAIDFRFGYVFAGCNLLAAIIVYFFLMESSQRTLEEVDTMYLTHVNPRKSAKWDVKEAGGLVTTDNLYLNKGARNIQKRDEANRESTSHDEGLMVAPGDREGVTEMNRNANPVMSSG